MKKQTLFAFIVVVMAAVPVLGQKIETQAPGSAAITCVETALNHLTVIELSEPVLSVAAGSQAFKVEWRENKVFVEPTEPNASTNLFIWTKSGRLNYELEPAGEVAGMDFAIDQPPIRPTPIKTPVAVPDPPGRERAIEYALLEGKPVRMSAYKAGRNRVQLLIKDLFQRDNRLFIRYAVENSTNHVYEIGTPQVFFLESPRGPKSLIQQRNSQLTDSEAGKIGSIRQVSLEVIHKELRSPQVKPGEETVGIVEVKVPAADRGATVLRLVLPESKQGQITATLVL
jgi:hypothetical protein